jgi:cyclopropane-fatty-acyl-phospholipid synthase
VNAPEHNRIARAGPGTGQAAGRGLRAAEEGWLPDVLIRAGVRRLLRERLEEIDAADPEAGAAASTRFARVIQAAEVAPLPALANAQHYEIPAGFFGLVLGQHRKYSSCYWDRDTRTLDAAEAAALAITCERAGLEDGQRILELGCGWGSLSLWMAAAYPRAQITAVSNSHSQRSYIESTARARGLGNLQVITADMNAFEAPGRYDRVVSVEMFEHMRNWPALFRRISRWLEPRGRFFMHVFVHRSTPYAFVDQGPGDWMSRHFFSGGIMPSDDLALQFQDDLRLRERWRWNGTHYQRTADAWLAQLDANRAIAMPLLADIYGERHARVWLQRWRIFFMSCSELFGYRGGNEWWVSHYLFERSGSGEHATSPSDRPAS